MRRILSSIMLIAVAAMASVSCQKEENAPVNETKSATLTLHATVADTKTYIEENTVLWGTGEYVQLYFNDGTNSQFVKSSADAADLWNGENSAMFSFDITYDESADSYVLGGIYPASCVVENNNNNNTPSAYKVTLPAIQNASASSYDPKAFIMVMQPQTVTTFDAEAHLASFRRAVALNKVTLTGVKESISSVEITLPEGKYLAGRRYFDLTTGVEGEVYNSQTNTIKVNADYTGSSIDVWFTSWGVELAEGDQVTIKMTSDSKVYTRTISVNSNGIKFVEGGLNKLAVNMATAEEEVLDNIAGEYLIAAMPADWMLMSGTGTSFFNRVESKVTTNSEKVTSSDFYGIDGIEDCIWVISEVEGGYAVQNKSTGKYISWVSGNTAVNSESAVAFSVSINDDKSGSIVHLTTTDRSLQYNSGSPRFAFYTSTQNPLYFIPWVEDTTPRISVSTNSIEVDADATSCEFTYELHNVTGTPNVTVADGFTMEDVSVSVEGNTVTVKFASNGDEEVKAATVVLSIDGAADVEVAITQAAVEPETPSTGGDIILTADWATNVGSLNTSGLTTSFTIDGYSYTASGASCYYYANGKACFLGKTNAFISLPAIDGYKLTNVTLTSASSTGGASVTIKDSNANSVTNTTASFNNGTSAEFSFDITSPIANESYRIYVTNNKNAHIAKWVLTYQSAN